MGVWALLYSIPPYPRDVDYPFHAIFCLLLWCRELKQFEYAVTGVLDGIGIGIRIGKEIGRTEMYCII